MMSQKVPSYNLSIGKIGEDIATNYLKKHSYRILRRNYRIRGGEIDIIAYDKNTLCFVEVKTRLSTQYGTPQEAITGNKLRFLTRAAQIYCTARNMHHLPLRLDAVVVQLANSLQPTSIELIKNISV